MRKLKNRSKKALNIRAVPEDLLEGIKGQAKAEHRTLRKWVLNALQAKLTPKPPETTPAEEAPPACPEEGTIMQWNEVTSYFQCPDCGFVLKPIPWS